MKKAASIGRGGKPAKSANSAGASIDVSAADFE